MWIDLAPWQIALANGLGIPLVQLVIAWLMLRVNENQFMAYNERINVNFYANILYVKSWQNWLPDAAKWFGGQSKRGVDLSNESARRNFARECRRGEIAHIIQLLSLMTFILWTPAPWFWVIVAWAAISNVPCILNLRYVRGRLSRMRH